MESKTNKNLDRREFYRVSCQANIEIIPLKHPITDIESQFDLPNEFKLLAELRLIGQESNQLLKQITDENKALGNYLKMLNNKIDILAGAMVSAEDDSIKNATQIIDISEGGLRFRYQNELAENQLLATKLTLLPDNLLFTLLTRVKLCEQPKNSKQLNLIHVEFEKVEPTDKQLLSRFILKQQRRNLNKKKEG